MQETALRMTLRQPVVPHRRVRQTSSVSHYDCTDPVSALLLAKVAISVQCHKRAVCKSCG